MIQLLSRLLSTRHDVFAEGLARDFTSLCPPDAVYKPKKRKDSIKLLKTVNRVYAAARSYQQGNKLSMYARARIGNEFMWRLRDAGYEDVLVERVTNGILLCLSGK